MTEEIEQIYVVTAPFFNRLKQSGVIEGYFRNETLFGVPIDVVIAKDLPKDVQAMLIDQKDYEAYRHKKTYFEGRVVCEDCTTDQSYSGVFDKPPVKNELQEVLDQQSVEVENLHPAHKYKHRQKVIKQ